MQHTLDLLGIPSLPISAFKPDAMGRIRLFKKDNSAPPPDPNIGLAAMRQAQLGEEFLALTRQQYEDSKPRQARMDAMSESIANQQMRIADASEGRALENFSRYKNQFVPIEDQFLQEAKDAGSLSDQQRAAGRALSDVRAQGDLERQATNRNMMSMGINPASGKFAATSRSNELLSASRAAGAATAAREGSRLAGTQMRASASNLGRGMMADTTAAGGLALNGGGGALNAQMAGNNYLMARNGTMGAGYQGAMAGQAGMANGLGNLYNAQVNQAVGKNNAEAQAVAGIAQAGAMAMTMSDIACKENIQFLRALPQGFNLYEFEYKPEFKDESGHGRYVGVMAQEVEKVIPEAVIVGADGYKRVNYAMLGV